jgi:hypothetical protein
MAKRGVTSNCRVNVHKTVGVSSSLFSVGWRCKFLSQGKKTQQASGRVFKFWGQKVQRCSHHAPYEIKDVYDSLCSYFFFVI